MNFVRKIHSKYAALTWTIGFMTEPIENVINGKAPEIFYLKHNYKDRWFADPWLLEVDNDTLTVLVEEKRYGVDQKGYISIMTVNRHNYELLELKTLLQLPTHLSFPAVLREDGKIYIYPENAEGEGLGLYEIGKEGICKHVRTLCKKPLADAVITDLFGERLLFCTQIPEHNGSKLSIYTIDIESGQTVLLGEYSFNSNIARNAGNWFKIGDKIIRPAQDCNGGYGKAVILQEVSRDIDGQFVFTDLCRLVSTHGKLNKGMHTFNQLNGVTVIDVYGFRYPDCVAKFIKLIFRFLLFLFRRN